MPRYNRGAVNRLKIRLAFISWRRATWLTETPATRVGAQIIRFSSSRQTLRLCRSTTSTCDNVHHHKWTLSPTIQLRQGGQAGRLQRERGLQRCFAPTPELTMPTGLVTTPEARRVHRVAAFVDVALTWVNAWRKAGR